MGKIVDFKNVIENETVKVRGYVLTIDNRYMTNDETIELLNNIKVYEERYNIEINPRQHMLKANQYILSIDFKTDAHKTFIKLFLTSNSKYKIFKRIKTWKELA